MHKVTFEATANTAMSPLRGDVGGGSSGDASSSGVVSGFAAEGPGDASSYR